MIHGAIGLSRRVSERALWRQHRRPTAGCRPPSQLIALLSREKMPVCAHARPCAVWDAVGQAGALALAFLSWWCG
jgi:hypothetical protein